MLGRHTGGTHRPLVTALAVLLLLAQPTLAQAATPTDGGTGEAPAVPGVTEPPWRAWRTQETVPLPEGKLAGDFAGDPHLAFDQDGDPHVAFTTLSPDPDEVVGVWHAHRDEGEWTRELVHPTHQARDLALDEDGDPWIVSNYAYLHTRNTTDGDWWRLSLPVPGGDPQVMVDPAGIVHVATWYVPASGPNEYVTASFDPDHPEDGWTTHTLYTFETLVTDGLDAAVTSDGAVHAVWWDGPRVQYAEPTGPGEWTVHRLSMCDIRGHIDSMAVALGPTNEVHLACWQQGTGVLHVTPNPDGGGFTSELVSDGSQLVPERRPGGIGFGTTLAVDADNRVHASYHTGINPFFPDDPTRPGRPVYAVEANTAEEQCSGLQVPALRWDAQSPCTPWHVQAVDHDGTDSGFGTSVAVDGQGLPGLAYEYNRRVADYRVPDDPVVNPNKELRFAEPVQRVAAQAAGASGVGG